MIFCQNALFIALICTFANLSKNFKQKKLIEMSVLNQVRFIVYRINKKGLEILLVNASKEGEKWQIPGAENLKEIIAAKLEKDERVIELDPIEDQNGRTVQAWAVEGDWHDIPSIRAMIKTDVSIVKDQIKYHVPELEKGTYFAVKEAFKKVLPYEYAVLKELKDIIIDRNQAKYI